MKVHPYLTVIQGQKSSQPRRAAKERPESSFEATLGSASSGLEETRAFEVVSLENRRAVSVDPPKDMAAAEALLVRAKEQLGDINRAQLRNIHGLEGLVHFYSV